MITKNNEYKLMSLFFDSPEKKFYIREIARKTGLSAPGVLKIVAKLKKEGLLLTEKNGPLEDVFAPKSQRFIQLKICHNLLLLGECGLVEFLRDVYEEPDAIVLFGSFARAEDTSTSDIDIAVVSSKEREMDLRKFERRLKKKVNVYAINTGECTKEFLNNLANGIVLHGHLRLLA